MEDMFTDCTRRGFLARAPFFVSGLVGAAWAGDELEELSDEGSHERRLERSLCAADGYLKNLKGRGFGGICSSEIRYRYFVKVYGLPFSGEAIMKLKRCEGNRFLSTLEITPPGGGICRLFAWAGFDEAKEALRGAEKCIVESMVYHDGGFLTRDLLDLDKQSTKPIEDVEEPRIRMRMRFDRASGLIKLHEMENCACSDTMPMGALNGPNAEWYEFIGYDGALSEKQKRVRKRMVCPLKKDDYLGMDRMDVGERIGMFRLVCQDGFLDFGGRLHESSALYSEDTLTFREPGKDWSRGRRKGIFFNRLYDTASFTRVQDSSGEYQIPAYVFLRGLASETKTLENADKLIELEGRMRHFMKDIDKRSPQEVERAFRDYERKRREYILAAEDVGVYLESADIDCLDWEAAFLGRLVDMCYREI